MSTCTPFCKALNGLQQNKGLPSRDELIERLPAIEEDGGWYLSTWHDVQQRTQCGFCQLVVIAVSDSIEIVENESPDPNERINVYLFPGEVSFRLSVPSRLGTRIAFVVKDEAQVQGPDTARYSLVAGVDIVRLKSWLAKCHEEHAACNEGKTKEEQQAAEVR